MIKKILFLSIIFFITNLSFGQCPPGGVLFTTQSEVDNFAIEYPNCTILNGPLSIGNVNNATTIVDLTPLSNLTQVSRLDIAKNNLLQTLDGLNNLAVIDGGFFAIQTNPILEDISALQNIQMINPDDLTRLFIAGNPLITSLDGLLAPGASFGFLGLAVFNMDGLSNLDGLEGIVSCNGVLTIGNNAQLQNLDALNSIMGSIVLLRITNNPLLNDITGLSNITGIDYTLNNETSVFEIWNNNQLTNLSGLENIEILLTGDGTASFSILNNTILTDISAIANMELSSINDLNFAISNNPDLSTCDINSICELLDNPDNATITIENNAPGCDTELEVAEACGVDINIISGLVRYDFNDNGCDSDDFNVQSILVETSDGTMTIGSFTNGDGHYQNILGVEGTVTTSIVQASLPNSFVATPESEETIFVGFGIEEVVDFCLTTTETIDNLELTLAPLEQAVPGFNSNYQLIYENRGTFIEEGEVTFEFDITRQSFVNATPAPVSVIGNIVTFDFVDLLPFESRVITIELNHFAPPINQIGDTTIFDALVEDEGDESPINNRSILEQIYVGSFDPNDIQVVQGSEILEAQTGDFLDYIIRFQNTGTEDAITVRVDHILDDHLDFETLRPLSSSHPYQAVIRNGNEVSFVFKDINLPPEELDEEESNGFIIFQVRPKNSFSLGDSVAASASIFFDFNEPIITNTVTTTVVDVLSLAEDRFRESEIKLYPNPVSGVLTIEVAPSISYIKTIVYSLLGEKLMETNGITIDFSNLSKGVYFMEVFTDNGSSTKKIIKK